MSRRRTALAVVPPSSDVPMPGLSGLTVKQERFARIKVETGNASEAYRRAFNVGPDTKPETVTVSAAQLLANPNVALRVAQIEAEALAATQLTVSRLVDEAFQVLERAKASDDQRAAVAAIALLEKLLARLTPEPGAGGQPESADVSRRWLEQCLAGQTVDKPPNETRDEWMIRQAREGKAKVPDAHLLAMAAGGKDPTEWLLERARLATPHGKAEMQARVVELIGKLNQADSETEFPIVQAIDNRHGADLNGA
jgi:phage terminase small subunit